MVKQLDIKELHEKLESLKAEAIQIEAAEKNQRRIALFLPIVKAAFVTAVVLWICNFT